MVEIVFKRNARQPCGGVGEGIRCNGQFEAGVYSDRKLELLEGGKHAHIRKLVPQYRFATVVSQQWAVGLVKNLFKRSPTHRDGGVGETMGSI